MEEDIRKLVHITVSNAANVQALLIEIGTLRCSLSGEDPQVVTKEIKERAEQIAHQLCAALDAL